MTLRYAESEDLRRITREIILEVFQQSNLCDHDTSTYFVQTDGRLAVAIPRALRSVAL